MQRQQPQCLRTLLQLSAFPSSLLPAVRDAETRPLSSRFARFPSEGAVEKVCFRCGRLRSIMPNRDSESSQPAAIDTTVLLWGGPVPLCVDEECDRDVRRMLEKSPSRRAKSQSPSRRSPKLKHTNGRLDEDPLSAAQDKPMSAAQRLTDKQQLVAHLQSALLTPDLSTNSKCMSASEIPKRGDIRRSATGDLPGVRRLKICYRDEALRERSAENTRRMIVNARRFETSPDPPQSGVDGGVGGSGTSTCGASSASICIHSNQYKLALKALKYRKLLARTSAIDDALLKDPTFDVLECLGVKWCKV